MLIENSKEMKKIFISILVRFTMFSVAGYAQSCDSEALLKQALKEMGDGQYIKDFKVELIKDKKDMKTGYVICTGCGSSEPQPVQIQCG